MKKMLAIVLTCSTIVAASAKDWDFARRKSYREWSTFGTVQASDAGLICGPESGSFAVSGILCGPISRNADGSVKVRVKLGDFKVITPAPDELENGNDIFVLIAINGSREYVWDSARPVACIQLFYNSENRGFWVELRGKGAGRARSVPLALLPGSFLGEGSGEGDLNVEINLTSSKISAIVSPIGGLAQTFEVPMPEDLLPLIRQPFFVLIYQQNIDNQGTGSVTIRAVSIM